MKLLIGLIIFVFAIFIYNGVKNRKKKVVQEVYEPIIKMALSPMELKILDLINAHRRLKKLPPLIPELLASDVCRKAIDQDFANGEKPNHQDWENRIKACKCSSGAEIIAPYYTEAESIVASYLRSDSHREAIENPIYTHIGVSYMYRTNYCILTKYN